MANALAEAELEPEALTLEITESVMMTDTELAISRLKELRALGVRLAMDDFGTGYSSLSSLSMLPLDILKMDRSLLAAGASPVTSGLASAVLSLGETFELEVVAEGIEYREQSATLKELGLRHRAGLLLRQADGARAPGQLPGGADRRGRRDSASRRLGLSGMQQSYEGLDRPGGFSRVRLLAPLSHRDYRLLAGGMSVSLLGDGLFLVALAWQVYTMSDAPTALATVGIAMTIPTITCLLIGGAVSDRFDRRVVMLTADTVRAIALAALAALAITAALTFWELLAIAVVYGAATAFFNPASDALVPQLLPADVLAQANSLDQLIRPMALRLGRSCARRPDGGSDRGRLDVRAGRRLVRGLGRGAACDVAGAGLSRFAEAIRRRPRDPGRPAVRPQPRLAVGDARHRRDRLPAVHGAHRGAAPVHRQAPLRRRRS